MLLFQARLLEATQLDDLAGTDARRPAQEIKLHKKERYWQGLFVCSLDTHVLPQPNIIAGPHSVGETQAQVPYEVVVAMNRALRIWQPNPRGVLNSGAAFKASVDLSAGGKYMTSKQAPLLGTILDYLVYINCWAGLNVRFGLRLLDSLSAAEREELTNLYISLNELLRHFWSCFPTDTQQLVTKAHHMKDTLVKFRDMKVIPFQVS